LHLPISDFDEDVPTKVQALKKILPPLNGYLWGCSVMNR